MIRAAERKPGPSSYPLEPKRLKKVQLRAQKKGPQFVAQFGGERPDNCRHQGCGKVGVRQSLSA